MTCGFISGLQNPYERETGAAGALPITTGIPIGPTYILQNKGRTALSPRIPGGPGDVPQMRVNVPQIGWNVPQMRVNVPQICWNVPQIGVNVPQICWNVPQIR